MSNIKHAYNSWAKIYDSNSNATRDLEATALKTILNKIVFNSCLEIGCGTGKNTEWLLHKTNKIVAVDFSEEMLLKAKQKISSNKVEFAKIDITNEWNFTNQQFDLISFSLVLEHIADLNFIFKEATNKLAKNGFIYIGELHPFKQYSGSTARFEMENNLVVVDCYTHHISEFTAVAIKNNLSIYSIYEFFDDDNRNNVPRILAMLLKKN